MLDYYLTDLNFLKIRREIELLSGLRQNNDDLINAITAVLDRRVPASFLEVGVEEFDGERMARLTPGTTLAKLNKIRRTRLSTAQVDELMDEVDRRALSRGQRRVTESIRRSDGDIVAAAREREAEDIAVDERKVGEPLRPNTHMAAIDTLASVVRNSDFSDFAIKGPATRTVLASWVRIFLLIVEEIDGIFSAIVEKDGQPLADDERDAIRYVVAKFFFSIVGGAVVHHLASPSISGTLRTVLASGEISTGERLLGAFLLEAIDDPEWTKEWSSIIGDRNRSGFAIDSIVTRLNVIVHTRALDDDQAARVKTVVDKIEQRFDWSGEQKNARLQDLRDAANIATLVDR